MIVVAMALIGWPLCDEDSDWLSVLLCSLPLLDVSRAHTRVFEILSDKLKHNPPRFDIKLEVAVQRTKSPAVVNLSLSLSLSLSRTHTHTHNTHTLCLSLSLCLCLSLSLSRLFDLRVFNKLKHFFFVVVKTTKLNGVACCFTEWETL